MQAEYLKKLYYVSRARDGRRLEPKGKKRSKVTRRDLFNAIEFMEEGFYNTSGPDTLLKFMSDVVETALTHEQIGRVPLRIVESKDEEHFVKLGRWREQNRSAVLIPIYKVPPKHSVHHYFSEIYLALVSWFFKLQGVDEAERSIHSNDCLDYLRDHAAKGFAGEIEASGLMAFLRKIVLEGEEQQLYSSTVIDLIARYLAQMNTHFYLFRLFVPHEALDSTGVTRRVDPVLKDERVESFKLKPLELGFDYKDQTPKVQLTEKRAKSMEQIVSLISELESIWSHHIPTQVHEVLNFPNHGLKGALISSAKLTCNEDENCYDVLIVKD